MNGFDQYAPTRGPISWKTIAIIGGTVILIILIIFGARWLISTKTEAGQQAAVIERVSLELDRTLSECDQAKIPEQCRADMVEMSAGSIGSAEICNKLTDDSLVTCVWKIALQENDPEACKNIPIKEKQTGCQDTVYRSLAGVNLDLSWCEKINSEIGKTRCINTVSEQIAQQKGCQGTGIDPSICTRQEALSKAIASRDPGQCMLLSNPQDQGGCVDSVGVGDKDLDNLDASIEKRLGISDENIDSDSDGLSDYDEYHKYKTDPAKSDTDGDGYSDKVEIDGGYNPLGEGRL
ncbi:MAG: hypothetical protein V1716_04195 [Candidatus Uhrbacteria bacterium]